MAIDKAIAYHCFANRLAGVCKSFGVACKDLAASPSMKANTVEMKDKAGALKSGQLVSWRLRLTTNNGQLTIF